MTNKIAVLLSSAALTLTSGRVLAAADAGPADDGIQEIVVTAQKRSENLETVPVAVTAFTSKERDLIGVKSMQDITDFTPGLAYSTVLDRAFIRGVGRETNNLATQPGVATYNDGLYNSSVVAASGDPLFVDHVEVLRGPQGTLYGRNSIGGTINSISRKPTSSWYSEVRANIGNYGTYNFEGAVSGPITDNLRFRFAGYRNTQEVGFFTNLAEAGQTEGGKGNYFYWEGQIEWDITQDLNFWLKFSQLGYNQTYRTYNSLGNYSYVPFPPGTLAPSAGFGFTTPGFTALGGAACATNPANENIRNFCTNTPSNSHLSRDYQVSPVLTWATPWGMDIKYIGGYTTYYYNLNTDFDGTSMQSYTFPVFPGLGGCLGFDCPPATVTPVAVSNYVENKKYYSNEIDFTSHNDSPFQWIVGLYQYKEHEDQPFTIPILGQTQLNTPLAAAPNANDVDYYTDLNIHANSYAAFAQSDWKIVPALKLTTGLRYNYDEERGSEATRQLCWGLPACLGLPGSPATGYLPGQAYYGAFTPVTDITTFDISHTPAPGVISLPVQGSTGVWSRQLGAKWHAVTGTAGLEWTPTDSTLTYFKYSRGYKAGGLNAGALVQYPETSPEYLDAFELGIKYTSKTFQINEAFFYYNYKGLQIPLSVQPETGPSISETFNIPKVKSMGLETEAIWRPIANWQFMLTYSWMEAYIDSSFSAVNAVSNQAESVYGNTVPFSPRHKVALNQNYTWFFSPGSLNFSTSWIYKAHTYGSIFNHGYYLAPSYSTTDARFTWTEINDRYSVIAYCHNLFNKIAYDGITAGRVATNVFNTEYTVSQTPGLIPPRQYGVEMQVRFK
jgi:iron complex outermembrane receptor protein